MNSSKNISLSQGTNPYISNRTELRNSPLVPETEAQNFAQKLFLKFDIDQDQRLDSEEMAIFNDHIDEAFHRTKSEHLKPDNIFATAELDEDGCVDFREFERWVKINLTYPDEFEQHASQAKSEEDNSQHLGQKNNQSSIRKDSMKEIIQNPETYMNKEVEKMLNKNPKKDSDLGKSDVDVANPGEANVVKKVTTVSEEINPSTGDSIKKTTVEELISAPSESGEQGYKSEDRNAHAKSFPEIKEKLTISSYTNAKPSRVLVEKAKPIVIKGDKKVLPNPKLQSRIMKPSVVKVDGLPTSKINPAKPNLIEPEIVENTSREKEEYPQDGQEAYRLHKTLGNNIKSLPRKEHLSTPLYQPSETRNLKVLPFSKSLQSHPLESRNPSGLHQSNQGQARHVGYPSEKNQSQPPIKNVSHLGGNSQYPVFSNAGNSTLPLSTIDESKRELNHPSAYGLSNHQNNGTNFNQNNENPSVTMLLNTPHSNITIQQAEGVPNISSVPKLNHQNVSSNVNGNPSTDGTEFVSKASNFLIDFFSNSK